MNKLYGLLYVPILGLAMLCLYGTIKLFQDRRNQSRKSLYKAGRALLAVALFTVSFAIMVATHAHSFKLVMLLIVCMGIVNLLRSGFPRAKA